MARSTPALKIVLHSLHGLRPGLDGLAASHDADESVDDALELARMIGEVDGTLPGDDIDVVEF